MRLSAILAAAAAALGARAEMSTNASLSAETDSLRVFQRFSKFVGSRHNLASIERLPQLEHDWLCFGTASAGSVDEAALRVVLDADGAADIDRVHDHLLERCHGGGPEPHKRAVAQPDTIPSGDKESDKEGDKEDMLCGALKNADSALDSNPLGGYAEAFGFADPFSTKFGRIFTSKCAVSLPPSVIARFKWLRTNGAQTRKHPHPNPSKPVDPRILNKPDPCQLAVVTGPGGSFTLLRSCRPKPKSSESAGGYGSNGYGSNGYGPDGYYGQNAYYGPGGYGYGPY